MKTEYIDALQTAIEKRKEALATIKELENQIQQLAAMITKEKIEESKTQNQKP